ncbi:MAG: SCO family protein [Actinomycetota bacterium]|nr:SCO family protein [Actinomycetota bacterium]
MTASPTTEAAGSGDGGAPGRRPAPDAARRARRRRVVALAIGVPVVLAAVAYLALQWFRPHVYSGTVLQAPEAAPSMDGLVYATGEPVDLAAFAGDVVLVYFGYTHCPDVCPTTLAMTARALDDLGAGAEDVHVMMVTVDPARDTPDLLDGYVRSFDPSFAAVTGDVADIERVATTYGVYFAEDEVPEGEDPDSYTVTHTASLMGIDTDGHLRVVWPWGVTADDLRTDIDALR